MKTKKILALCLCLVMLFQLVVPMTVSAAEVSEGTFGENNALTWTWDSSSGTIKISGNGAMPEYTDSKMTPWEHLRKKVNFVDIGEGVTAIGAYTFAHHKLLRAINIPSTIKRIGNNCFARCELLEEVLIPATATELTELTGGEFSYCYKLVAVSLPTTVTRIGKYTFHQCESLETVYYPGTEEQWKSIEILADGNSAVLGLTPMYGVEAGVTCTLVDGVLTYSGFGGINNYLAKENPYYAQRSQVTSIVIGEGITRVGGYSCGYFEKATSVSLPSTLRTIGYNAFYNCKALTEVVIPNSVTYMFNAAFYGCAALKTVTLPSGISTIEKRTFGGCNALENIKFGGTEIQWAKIVSVYDQEGQATFNALVAEGNVEILTQGLKGTVIDNVLYITGNVEMEDYTDAVSPPWKTSENTANVTKIVVAEGVPNISDYAFYGFAKVTEIELPTTVKSIGVSAFRNCSKLESIKIPHGVEEIESNAFYRNYALKTIYIPKSVTTINTAAFAGTNNSTGSKVDVETIYYEGSEEEWNAIKNVNSITQFNTAKNLDQIYYNAYPAPEVPEEPDVPVISGWEYADGVLTVTENIADFAEGSAPWNEYANDITSVVIADAVTALPTNAFAGLNITSVVIPEDVTVIPAGAFKDCTALTNVTAPAGITAIGENALAGCTALTTVYYDGTEEEYENISVAAGNEALATAEIVFTGKPGGGIELPDFDF